MRVLFIGNSHTYYNEMPRIFQEIAEKNGCRVDAAMIAHGGWYLKQHLEEKSQEAALSIRIGHYDYVVLQEHTHPFEEEDAYLNSVQKFCEMIRSTGAVPVIYATWAKKADPSPEEEMERLQKKAADLTGALYAPVGEQWWKKMRAGEADFFGPDGQHANRSGSELAAGILWEVISSSAGQPERTDG